MGIRKYNKKMRIANKRKIILRSYQKVLFSSEDNYSFSERCNSFYYIVRPLLGFLEDSLKDYMPLEEIEGEIYLFIVELFKKYDKKKSSIVPYLENAIPWELEKLFKRLNRINKRQIIPNNWAVQEKEYTLNEEFYWKNIILEEHFVGKCFTRGEKYLISIITKSDSDELSVNALARKLNITRWSMKDKLEELKEIFQLEEINDKTKH